MRRLFFVSERQVKFMKRIAEMSDLSQVTRTLPRIRKHLLNPDNMRCWLTSPPHRPDAGRPAPGLGFWLPLMLP